MTGWHWKPPRGAAHYYEHGHSLCGVVLTDLRSAQWMPVHQCQRCDRSLARLTEGQGPETVFFGYSQVRVEL
jgi:hypothetical protein